jgi:hypothetical protein
MNILNIDGDKLKEFARTIFLKDLESDFTTFKQLNDKRYYDYEMTDNVNTWY